MKRSSGATHNRLALHYDATLLAGYGTCHHPALACFHPSLSTPPLPPSLSLPPSLPPSPSLSLSLSLSSLSLCCRCYQLDRVHAEEIAESQRPRDTPLMPLRPLEPEPFELGTTRTFVRSHLDPKARAALLTAMAANQGRPRMLTSGALTSSSFKTSFRHPFAGVSLRPLTSLFPLLLSPCLPGVYAPPGPRPPIDLTAVAIYSSQVRLFPLHPGLAPSSPYPGRYPRHRGHLLLAGGAIRLPRHPPRPGIRRHLLRSPRAAPRRRLHG